MRLPSVAPLYSLAIILTTLHSITMVETRNDETKIQFNGSNWEDLDRLIGLARFQFLQDDDYDDNGPRRCAYLSQRFTGPALDWVTSTHMSNASIFENWEQFVTAVKQAFGVEANGIQALRRRALDELRWHTDVPVFFAEFDRLVLQLGISDHGTRIVMVQQKLPFELKCELARQALDFTNYETMRERLISMWALSPTKRPGTLLAPNKKPRCGSCGKSGHTAKDCHGGSKN